MGLTERHWFENEEPKLTDRQLEDIVYEIDKAYKSGYIKGYSDRDAEIVQCADCRYSEPYNDWGKKNGIVCDGIRHNDNWFCANGKRK